ncbi:MAG: GNAT family N-acetyltransferase [Rhodobacter sp.]|jgi:RimJ/RimL family protein N-acetyltransferase|nr:GNAT family N-acetyltransferase [Rhodobacter sp.]MBK8438141.1 GNAT family N-acetyltransferase [Rhodobacter sp.]
MLRRAEAGDLPRIAALIAAHPMQLLGQDEGWLATQCAAPENRVMVWDRGGFAGFAVLELAYPQVVNLMNLAVTSPGRGEGRALIRAALDVAFRDMSAHRLFCDIAHDNEAALAAFAAAGLQREGTMRHCWLRAGIWEDCHAFAILRDEWTAAGG